METTTTTGLPTREEIFTKANAFDFADLLRASGNTPREDGSRPYHQICIKCKDGNGAEVPLLVDGSDPDWRAWLFSLKGFARQNNCEVIHRSGGPGPVYVHAFHQSFI